MLFQELMPPVKTELPVSQGRLNPSLGLESEQPQTLNFAVLSEPIESWIKFKS